MHAGVTVKRERAPSESDDDTGDTAPWKLDLVKLKWKDGELDWMDGAVKSSQIGAWFEITRCVYESISYFLTSQKTGARRWVSEARYPNLCELLNLVYIEESSSPNDVDGPIGDELIAAVREVRHDVFDNGSVAYWVEWKVLPEMNGEVVNAQWVEEKCMPERWVEAHISRCTSDILEYGPIELPSLSPDRTPSADRIRTHLLDPHSVSSSSPDMELELPRNQSFPVSPLQHYSPPAVSTLLPFDESLHDSSDEEYHGISRSELMAKIKPTQTQRSSTQVNSTSPSQALVSPVQKISSSVPVASGARSPPPSIAVNSRPKPRPKKRPTSSLGTADDDIVLISPPRVNLDANTSKPLSNAKGKRKAEPILTPPPKRTKSHSIHPLKHDDFWHLDGNVIIQIENTRFRLHRSRLVQQSEYFAEMFERKDRQIDPGPEIVDGYPLYLVSSVSAKDFAVLLHALDDAITFYYDEPPFDVVASILRVSTTLSFTHFRRWAVRYLEEMWSQDLADLSTDRLCNAVQTIILGRKYDVRCVLKRAFYELLRTGGLGHLDATDDEDDDPPPSISASDTRRLIRTREQLSERWLNTLTTALDTFPCPNAQKDGTVPDPTARVIDCPSNETKATKWTKLVYQSGMLQEYMYDPLCGLKVLVDHDWKGQDGFCKDCVKMRRDAWGKQREKLWQNLDLYLELK